MLPHPVGQGIRPVASRGRPYVTPERRSQSAYADIIADLIAQGAESVQVTIEGMKPATLRAGLRRALKSNDDVKLVQRGEETFLVRRVRE